MRRHNPILLRSDAEALRYGTMVADAYLAAPVFDESQAWRWKLLIDHVERLFERIQRGKQGVKVVYVEGQPYADERELQKGVEETGILYVSTHSIFTPEQNLKFRAVHDYMTHIARDVTFGLRGEIAAYNTHAKMVPPDAVPALFTEVLGQASTFIAKGFFPEQKIALLPFDYYNIGIEMDSSRRRRNPAELLLLNPEEHTVRKPSKVQSVIVPKDRFTKRQAQAWVAEHGFIDPGVDETDDYYRFRQMDPDRQHFKYRTIPFGDSGVQAVVRVSRLPQMRSNPGAMTTEDALEVLADANADEASINRALAVLAGGSEVAQALDGSGLVPAPLVQATQIAEVQTSRGVVDVPVAEAPQFAAAAPAVDPSKFYDGRGNFLLLTAFRKLGRTEGSLSDYLHSLSGAEIKKIASNQRETKMLKGKSKAELIDKLVKAAEAEAMRGIEHLMLGVEHPSVDEAVQVIDNAIHVARTATRFEQTTGLKERVQQLLEDMPPSGLKRVAAHYNVDLRRTPADGRVNQIIERTLGYTLTARAIRGDYEEDEEARVREREERQQWMIAQYREQHGLPPAQASGVEGPRSNPRFRHPFG